MTESLPPNCLLYIDQARFADGGTPGEVDADPVALSGLRVSWGRTTSLDQPAPATAEFEVLDMPGGVRFLDKLHIGGRVEITAGATIYGDPELNTIVDPGFETRPLAAVPSSIRNYGTAKVVGAPTHTGSRAVQIDSTGPQGEGVQIIFPPKPFSTTDVSAWDTVPRTIDGQRWAFGAWVRFAQELAFAGRGVRVRPVAFDLPTGRPYTYSLLNEYAMASPGVSEWQQVGATFIPPNGVWLGIAVEMFPTGPEWAELQSFAWSSLGDSPTWEQVGRLFVDDLTMLAPAGGAARSGTVFAGRITDMGAEYDEGKGGVRVGVTAQDDLAELANRYVGAAPWAKESLNSRFSKIVAESGQGINWTVDAGVQGYQVTYRDVDHQPAAGLLQELARSVAGVVWEATSITSGPFLRLEDIGSRQPMMLIGVDTDGLIRIVLAPDLVGRAIVLDACDVLLAPIRWEQDTADASSRVTLTWQEQVVDPDPPNQIIPTSREVTAIDPAVELATGRRTVSVSTELTTSTDGNLVASEYLARLSQPGWRVTGLTLDMDAEEQLTPEFVANVMTILDGVTRIGLGIIVENIPDWAPAGGGSRALYLEGGRFTNEEGAWTLELITSAAGGQGQAALRWQDMPGASTKVRTNRAPNPRAVNVAPYSAGWTALRGFGTGGAGNYSWAGAPVPFWGLSTVRRKTWTTASSNPSSAGHLVYLDAVNYFPVVAGQVITVSAFIRHTNEPAVSRTFVCRLAFWSTQAVSGAVQVGSTVQGSGVPTAVDQWVTIKHTATVPAGALGMGVYLDTPAGTVPAMPVNGIIDVTGLMIEIAPDVTPGLDYIDGWLADSPPPAEPSLDYAWTGAADASTSTLTITTAGDAWAWNEFAPEVSWDDLNGVAFGAIV